MIVGKPRSAAEADLNPVVDCSQDGRTKQSFKDECDVNHIMNKYKHTGVLVDPVSGSGRPPLFGDFTGQDFATMQNAVAQTRSEFERLPASVRNRFDNDPGLLLEWLADPANAKEAENLGLKATETPPNAQTAPEPTPSPETEPLPSEP